MEEDLWKQMNWNHSNDTTHADWCTATAAGDDDDNNGMLGRIRLFYCSPEPLTPEELNGTGIDDDDEEENDMPPYHYTLVVTGKCSYK